MRVQTTVTTPLWSLSADTADPQGDLAPSVCLIAPLQAGWATDVLPPAAQPSTVSLKIYDDGTGVNWVPLDVGTPISVYMVTSADDGSDETTGPVIFQGRIAEASGENVRRGGVLFSVVCTDRLGDLTGSPAPRRLRGAPPTTAAAPVEHALFRMFDRVANHAEISLDTTAGGGEPFWDYARTVEMQASTLDALNLLCAHDVRDGVFSYPSFDVDPGDVTPLSDVDYQLVSYDPAAVDDLAGILDFVLVSGVWELHVNTDYYLDHDGMVLEAANVLLSPGDWRKSRRTLINTVELAGAFKGSGDWAVQVGIFEGNSANVPTFLASPNVTPLPAGLQDGDVAWCVISGTTGINSDPVVPPDGWVQHPTGPLQSSSNIRSWLFTAELTEADSGTVPVWEFSHVAAAPSWILTGGVVRDSDGMDWPPNNSQPGTSLDPVPSSASTAVTFPPVAPGGRNRLAYALASLRMGTGAANNMLSATNGWDVQASSQTTAATSRLGHYAVSARLQRQNPANSVGALSASGVNNGIAWSFTFSPSGGVDSVRAVFLDLVDEAGRNARALDSFLYYREDAEDLAAWLLGDRTDIDVDWGLVAATIVWETLTVDQREAWSRKLWPTADGDAIGKPLAIVNVPDEWRLVDGAAVFGRLVGMVVDLAGAALRVGCALRALPVETGTGITATGLAALAGGGPTAATIDPTITAAELSLVED